MRRIGTRLELDTDGIWCALPASFPENFKVRFLPLLKNTLHGVQQPQHPHARAWLHAPG